MYADGKLRSGKGIPPVGSGSAKSVLGLLGSGSKVASRAPSGPTVTTARPTPPEPACAFAAGAATKATMRQVRIASPPNRGLPTDSVRHIDRTGRGYQREVTTFLRV